MTSPIRQSLSVVQIARIPAVSAAREWFVSRAEWITDRQTELTEIPAPPFGEAKRAQALHRLLTEAGWRTRLDQEGNVIAESHGAGDGPAVLISAHLDTALIPESPIRVRRDGSRLFAPGITDNGAGLAALVALASVFPAAGLKTRLPVVMAGNVGEEGEGNLRGMQALVAQYGRRLHGVIVIDSASLAWIATAAVASRRIEATFNGPGGHSWADAGAPNPIHALGRAISRIAAIPLPAHPLTTLNVTTIEGGIAVNAIPARAAMKLDLRSESETELDRLEREIRRAIDLALLAEKELVRRSTPELSFDWRVLGARPAGRLPSDSPLLAAIREVDLHLGIAAECRAASTDANIPLSRGIPAIAVGCGGMGGGAHTSEEWYDSAGRHLGLERILLALLLVAGVEA